MSKSVFVVALAVVGLATFGSRAQQASQQSSQAGAQQAQVSCGAEVCPYLNSSLGPVERAKDLVSRMTLEEKASQMLDVAPGIPRLGVPAYNCGTKGCTVLRATVSRQIFLSRSGWRPPGIRS